MDKTSVNSTHVDGGPRRTRADRTRLLKYTKPTTEQEDQPTRRCLSQASIGGVPKPHHGQTSDVKLRRSSSRSTIEGTPVDRVLITLVPAGDEADEWTEETARTTADWTAGPEAHHENEDYGNTSHGGDDYEIDINIDNGYDTDLEVNDEEFISGPAEFDPSGIKDYVRECNRLGIIPCTFFKRHVHATQFCMRNHGLGPLGAKAIAKPLEFNTSIEKVDLEGNCIGAEGAKYFARMIKDNTYITELVLSENNLSSLGAQCMCETLTENSTVRTVDLSGNNFGDADGDFFLKLLENNSTIRQLYLSHNNFGSTAAQAFKDALTVNESLRLLDLSWNHFRLKGACLIAEGIKENYGLKELRISMNGFANEGAKAMGVALKQNQCLEQLDLSSNRITSEGALDIGRALATNSDLKCLKMGGNPLSHIGALTLLTAITKNENTEMNFLHIAGVVVDDDFEALHRRMTDSRPFTVVHGGVMSKKRRIKTGHTKRKTDEQIGHILMTKLRKYIDDSGFRLVDLLKHFDKSKSWSVDKDEFLQGVKKSGIDMTDDEIMFLAEQLDKDGDGEIDYGELVFADNKQRETKRKFTRAAEENNDEADDDVASIGSVDRMLNALNEDPDSPTSL